MKERTKKSAKKRAWQAFSRYIRLRDCLATTKTLTHGKCFTCGRLHPIDELQAGHFVAGRTNSVLFDELGVRAQDARCNIFRGGEPLLFRRRLVDELGENIVRSLEDKKWRPKTYSMIEFDSLYHYYTKKIAELEDATGRLPTKAV